MSHNKLEKQWQNEFSEAAEEAAKKDKEDYQISLWTKEGLESYIKYFFEYFNSHIQKDNSQTLLLDLGCGPGTFSKLLAQKGFQVWGVDYSQPMIEIAKKRSGNQKINFQVASIYHLPFENNYFDIVICLGVFQSIEKTGEALREIKRVLKNGGLLIITSLNCFSFTSLFRKEAGPLLKRYNPYKLKIALRKENFSEIELKGIYFFPRPLNFLTNFILKLKIYKLFNLLFPFFLPFSHSFYIEGRKKD